MTDVGNKRKHQCKFLSEKEEFTWELPNFREMIAENPDKNCNVYSFKTGDNIGLPTSWDLYLLKNSENQLGLFMRLANAPEEVKTVKASFEIKTVKCKVAHMSRPYEFTPTTNAAIGWSNALFSLDDYDEDNLEDGSLIMNITFCIHKDVIEDEEHKRRKLQHESHDEAAVDFENLLESEDNTDVTFEMEDGRMLKAHAMILKARNPVFSAMLQTQMQESSSGIIHIEDLSYETMKAILKYIYTGKLDDKWEELAEEIVDASNKYGLLTLLKFCDENLASTCKPENAWHLMDFAKLHGLKTAQFEIADYFRNNLDEILDAKLSS